MVHNTNMEELQRSEGVQWPATSKAVVLQLIGVVLSSEWTAQQIMSEAAWKQEKMPKASGSGSMINVASYSELDSLEDCLQCICQGQRCTWDLRGKAKSCIPCWDNKQRCEPVGASGAHPPLKRIMEEPEDTEGLLNGNTHRWWAILQSCLS